MSSPRICEKGGENFLPLLGDAEQEWPPVLRFVLYLIGLGWCFLGVGIASDLFMGAIETITSKTKQIEVPGLKRTATVKVWNPTVANLTLMALGSSAPEILLSIIELLSNSFYSGDLGPSTIVGSASFNLLCIIAVCVYAIPEGEFRKIEQLPVYCVTAVFSVFAYLWLVFILLATSPNVVEIWEAVLTLLFFPILVGLAFAADKGYLTGRKETEQRSDTLPAHMTKDELQKAVAEVNARWSGKSELTDEQIYRIINIERSPGHSRAERRHEGMKTIMGVHHSHAHDGHEGPSKSSKNNRKVHPETDKVPTVDFESANYGVAEHCGHVELAVIRSGPLDTEVTVPYRTEDGTAKADHDHIAVSSTITFPPHSARQVITIKIKDDNATEQEEEFYVILDPPTDPPKASDRPGYALGERSTATVVILDDDTLPTIQFEHDRVNVVRGGDQFVEKEVVVRRKGKPQTEVRCMCTSCDDTATAGQDYEKVEQELVFKEGHLSEAVKVRVLSSGCGDAAVRFKLVLTEPSGGLFNPRTEGGEDSDVSHVEITTDASKGHHVDKVESATSRTKSSTFSGHASWKAQFCDALQPDDEAEEDDESPGCYGWFMHIICLPWKLLGAFVPPPEYCGGWLAFVCSLLYIGAITAIIGDLAALVGCVTTVIPDSVTAITLVALGTSLPDTFASMQAATQDPTADASIGNVTGSNSVNVFLGLGLPWTFASIYWTAASDLGEWSEKYAALIQSGDVSEGFSQGAFVVPAGTLSSNITVFCCCACTCIAVLAVRRKFGEGELGGGKVSKTITSAILVTLWVIYVAAASVIAITNEN